jgi:hypothetical protein
MQTLRYTLPRRITSIRALSMLTTLLVALALLVTSVSTAPRAYAASRAGEQYHLAHIGEITVPGAPSAHWCFDLGAIAPGPLYLLANASQRQITLASDRSDTYVGKIGQPQDFTGEAGCHAFDFSRMGPEGVLSVGKEVWAGNGNSQVEVFSLVSHQRLFTIDTHGVNRADEMAVGEGLLAVTNPDEPHTPFLSFIDLKTHTIVKHLPFPQATAGLEQPAWFGGKWYLSVPETLHHPGGEVDIIDPDTWSVTPMAVPQCTPAGLVITRRGEAAVGCASGPQALLDVRTGKIIARVPVSDVDVVASLGDHFFFASYGSAPGQQPVQQPQLVAADCHGHLLARVFTTPVSHTVTVDPINGHILVPLDGGKILVLQEVH